MKVLIIDDHDVVRRGLRQILLDEFKKIQVGEARNADEALKLVQKQDWDIAVLDINMPGKGGLEVMPQMRKLKPTLPILVLSVQPEEQYAIPVLKAGASGYLSKDSASEELVNAFKKVLRGDKYISSAIADRLAKSAGKSNQLPHEQLSNREFQVLRLLASGKTTSIIASELDLSIQAVSTYRTRILKKLHLNTNADLIRYAMQAKLV